jgi:hypothetical protein
VVICDKYIYSVTVNQITVVTLFNNRLRKPKGAIKNGQSRDTGNMTQDDDKQDKKHNTFKTKKMRNTNQTKEPVDETRCSLI